MQIERWHAKNIYAMMLRLCANLKETIKFLLIKKIDSKLDSSLVTAYNIYIIDAPSMRITLFRLRLNNNKLKLYLKDYLEKELQ